MLKKMIENITFEKMVMYYCLILVGVAAGYAWRVVQTGGLGS